MNESILNSVKRGCDGIPEDDTSFDSQLIDLTNTALAELEDLGVNRTTPYFITGATEKWSDWAAGATIANQNNIASVVAYAKKFVSDMVRLGFDPPQSSTAVGILQESIKRNGSRIRDKAELKGG